MKDRENILKEELEDAYFKLLMSKIAKAEGAELIKLNEQLEKDPDFEVPESVTKACLDTIRKETGRNQKWKTNTAIKRFLIRTACVAALAGCMLVTCYAAFPDFRAAALNLLIQTSDVASKLIMTDEKPEDVSTEMDSSKVVMGYRIPVMPLGFSVNGELAGEGLAWVRYANKEGAWIKFSVYENAEYGIAYDDEEAKMEPIQIQGKDAMLYKEKDLVKILWNDLDTDTFILVEGFDLDEETVQRFANGICLAE